MTDSERRESGAPTYQQPFFARYRRSAWAFYFAWFWLLIAAPGRAQGGPADLTLDSPNKAYVFVGKPLGEAWVAEYWPDGRLASVRCDEGIVTVPLQVGLCRYKDYTGTLSTYYQNGAPHEVFQLKNGLLDGPFELFDINGLLSRRQVYINGALVDGDLPSNLRTVETTVSGQRLFELYWPSERLAEVRCMTEQGMQQLRSGKCRYKAVTGVLTTHHGNGAISQVFHLQNGVLDGLVEIYDPQGHLTERLVFRDGTEETLPSRGLTQLMGMHLGPVERLPVAPALPAAIRGSGPPGAYLPRPPFRISDELGLGTQIVTARSSYGTFTEAGVMTFYWLRQVHRWLMTEADFALWPNWGIVNRGSDWPLLRGGIRVPLTNGKVVPFLLSGATLILAQTIDPTSDPNMPSYDTAWYLGLDAGLGLSYRVGESTWISADIRFARNFRIDPGPHLLLPGDSGTLEEFSGSYYACVANFGAGFRF